MSFGRWVQCALVVCALAVASAPRAGVEAQGAGAAVPVEVQARADAGERVRIIVGLRTLFTPEGDLRDAAAVADQHGRISATQDAFLARHIGDTPAGVIRFETIPFVALNVEADGLAAIAADADVFSIEPDALARPELAQSVPLVGGTTVHNAGYRGAGTYVAILDTGVDSSHSFFGGRVGHEACYSNAGGAGSGTTVCPGGGTSSTATGSGVNCTTSIAGCDHGTHVAGIAAGSGSSFTGVAPAAGIAAIQVFSRFDDTSSCGSSVPCALSFTTDQIRGLERVLALRNGGVPVVSVNMSLGGGRFTSTCDSQRASTKAAIDNLLSVGVATIIASGNDGYTDSMGAPGCISTAVSVGSTTKTDTVSSFSNRAPFLSLMATGSSITASVPGGGFAVKSGTSMATPHVAGAWALIKQVVPGATPAQILSALQATGAPINDPLSDRGPDRVMRVYPRIQIVQAAQALLSPGTTVPGAPQNVRVVSVSGSTVTLSWSAPTTGGAATGYLVDAGTASGSSNVVSGLNVGNTTTVSGALAAGTYYVRIRASNSSGAGISSSEVSFSIGGLSPPGAPVNFAATASGTTVTLTWGAPTSGGAPSTYLISVGTSPSSPNNIVSDLPVGNTLSVSGTLPNGTYYAVLRAANSAGAGAFSNQVQFVIGSSAAPGAPRNLVGSVLGTSVVLTWTEPAGGGPVGGYLIEAGSSTGLANLATLNVAATARSFTTPAPAGVFFVRIKAFNSAGTGPASNEVVVLPSQNTCTGDFSATLTWNTGSATGSPNYVDMDLHVREPNNTHVYYGNQQGTTARLDRDNTRGFGPENICTNAGAAASGTYSVYVVAYGGNQFPTLATITVRSNVGTASERYQTFSRTFTAANSSIGQNVATVTFPGGTITETTGTRTPDPAGTLAKEDQQPNR